MNTIKVLLQANLENVSVARGIISSFLSNEDITVNVYNEIKTVVSEAITNAIVHGYQNDDSKYVGFDCILNNNLLTMIIKDEGVGIEDIDKAKEPLYSSLSSEERAGLGFTIMEIFSDNLEIISNLGEGTTIRIEKKLKMN